MEAQNYFFAKPDRRVVKEALDWANLVHIEDPFPLSAVVVREAVRRADLYVHCANVEVEGMGCMEAFAAGTVPVIADSALSSTSAYALSGQNRYKAGNVQELTRKIDYWFEHRADLPKVGEDYIALAKTLSIEESARKVIAMMEDTAKAFEK